MIITRTPLRVSFVGGGSDLPSYYKSHGGCVISMAINKYVYVSLNKSFSNSVRVAYSVVEERNSFDEVNHPLVRNCTRLLNVVDGLEITSTADIPAKGTGLGSSSSYTVGLLHALSNYQGSGFSKAELAELACKIEIEMCDEPIGKQDQYAASFGGINIFEFQRDGTVDRQAIEITPFDQNAFLNSMMIFYTGLTRSASSILSDQTANTLSGSKDTTLREMVGLVRPFAASLSGGDVYQCGKILDENWKLKKSLSNKISNDFIDEVYDEAIAAGAFGGKLLGAGAGGFMMFLAPQSKHRSIAMRLSKLKQQYWGLDIFGTSIIHHS